MTGKSTDFSHDRNPTAAPQLQARPDETLARTGSSGYRTELIAGGHVLLADEPLDAGGSGSGPSPYDLLSAALAACTTMTVQAYARLKKLPLESALARVRHNKIHAADCADCETREGKIDRFERVLELTGNLSAEQRQKLLEIANKCPVHRTLRSEVIVETRLA
jgi:uncharacterized OsmC-like protein